MAKPQVRAGRNRLSFPLLEVENVIRTFTWRGHLTRPFIDVFAEVQTGNKCAPVGSVEQQLPTWSDAL